MLHEELKKVSFILLLLLKAIDIAIYRFFDDFLRDTMHAASFKIKFTYSIAAYWFHGDEN